MQSTTKILVVEDERLVREAIKRKLLGAGMTVLEAVDGQEGLDTALREKPDLILLDILLPVMDGISVLEKLREDEWGKNVPIIILSNLYEAATVEESKKRGVYDYLVKTDWTLDDVLTKVKSTLKIS